MDREDRQTEEGKRWDRVRGMETTLNIKVERFGVASEGGEWGQKPVGQCRVLVRRQQGPLPNCRA